MADPITIAVDAAGGYEGPKAVVSAIGELSREAGAQPLYYILVGDERSLSSRLVETRHNPERISVVHAPDDTATVTCGLVKDGQADAFVTAGNPGAAVLAAHAAFDRIPGVDRAALATVYPTWDADGGQRFCLLLDVGATLRASASDLVHFALMGSAYARIVTDRELPTVGLLSIAPNANVGPDEVVEAARRLSDVESIDFRGTVEGHDIPLGGFDVVVCEGFVGDVVIKVLEGFAEAAFELAENAYQRKFSYRMGLRLLSPGLRKIRHAVDFEEYGGAPLLGFDRVVILADPRSGAKSIANAVKLAVKNVRADLPTQIASMLA